MVSRVLYNQDDIDKMVFYIFSLEGPKIPIVVSLDCNHNAIRDLILSAGPNITLIENPNQSPFNLTKQEKKYEGYYRIARHYHFALDYVFSVLKYQSAIITEGCILQLLRKKE